MELAVIATVTSIAPLIKDTWVCWGVFFFFFAQLSWEHWIKILKSSEGNSILEFLKSYAFNWKWMDWIFQLIKNLNRYQIGDC